MDNMTKRQRSRTMSRIGSKETRPEQLLRSALFREGYRFRKNVSALPGRPDIVLKKYKTVIFVNGCFWHQHENCDKAKMPKSNRQYWKPKLEKNIERDNKNQRQLISSGWKVFVFWECEIGDNIKSLIDLLVEEFSATEEVGKL